MNNNLEQNETSFKEASPSLIPDSKPRVKRTGFPRWWNGFQGSELLPIIPAGAPIAPDSDVKAGGKTPGRKGTDGLWRGLGGSWPKELHAELPDVKAWHTMGASVGLQTRIFVAADLDVEDEKVADDLEELANEYIGPAPVRYRTGSNRRLLLYRIADGETPLRKTVTKFLIGDKKQAVELLGFGQQCVVEGPHPKGGEYKWRNGHPCEIGPSGLSEITADKKDKFFAAVRGYLDMFGYTIIDSSSRTGAAGARKKIGDPSLLAPDPQDVLDILAAVPCDETTFPTRDSFVAALAAIKASLGGEYWSDVLEWALNYPGATDDYLQKIWDSYRDAEVGWSWLDAWARSHGYAGGAQKVFNDDDAAEASAAIPENVVDKMLKENVWVKDQEKFHNIMDGSWNTQIGFNASNSNVRQFGQGGQNSAAALFLNSPQGEKVITTTLAPGAPTITEAPNKHGKKVRAVNLWRASPITPAKNVRDEDVRPYLDLTERLFGPPSNLEREHVLNFLSYSLQKPGKKIGHALVLTGPQGVGKDSFLRPFFEGVGIHNVASISTKDLHGQFNYYLKYPIIYYQEAKIKNQHDLYNELKPFVSAQASFLSVNEKGLRQYFVPNIQTWIVSSNHDDAIALEADDRRFSVHRVLLDEPPGDDYFADLHEWYNNGGIEKVVGWLLARDLSAFNPMAKPAETAAKRRMLQETQSPTVQWLRELIGEDGRFAGRRVLTVRELRAATKNDWTAPSGKITERQITDALKAEGFKAAHRVRLGNAMERLWARGLDGTMTAEAMRELYQKETEKLSCEAA